MGDEGRAFLPIDEVSVERIDDQLRVRAHKTVDASDAYLAGHFPGFTVYPGVFVLECVRRAVASAVHEPEAEVRLVRSIFFQAPLLAGERMSIDARVRARGARNWLVDAQVSRADGIVAARIKAELGVLGGADA